MGHLVEMAGLAVQNFVSAAVGHRCRHGPGSWLRPPSHQRVLRARQVLSLIHHDVAIQRRHLTLQPRSSQQLDSVLEHRPANRPLPDS